MNDAARGPRWAWALTGSGHFFTECLELIRTLNDADLFVSRAASEVVRMYKQKLDLPPTARMFHDTTASAAPVGAFYYGEYHTLVVGPATSNTVANACSASPTISPPTSLPRPANAVFRRSCLPATPRRNWKPRPPAGW